VHLLVRVIPKFIQIRLPLSLSNLPHAVIEPSALRAAKAFLVE
jgi:hypothetical protein